MATAPTPTSPFDQFAIGELCPLGIVVFNDKGSIIFVNDLFQELTGLSSDQLIGKCERTLNQAFSQISAPSTSHSYFPCNDTTGSVITFKAKPSNKSLIEGYCSFRASADPCGCIFAIHTPEVRYIRRTMRSKSTSESGVTRILFFEHIPDFQKLENLKKEFIVNASHEFRTPLSLIIGYAEILQSYEADKVSKDWMLASILNNSRLLSEQIDQMLDLASIDARIHSHTVLDTIDILQVLIGLCAGFQHPNDARRPTLTTKLINHQIKGNTQLLTKCFSELLSNAFQYSFGQGAIQITVATDNMGYCHIRIEDNGIGMSAEEAKLSTSRFWRAKKDGSNPGIGLGLSIAKEVISLHGGELDIQSAPGKGTCITVRLPPLL